MCKKILLTISMLIITLSLCACSDINIDIEKNGNNINTNLILDNNVIKANLSDISLFNAKDFEAEIDDDDLEISTTIDYVNFEEDFSKKADSLKEILVEINPSLKNKINDLKIEPKRDIKGFPFSGTDTMLLTTTIPENSSVNINVNGQLDSKAIVNGYDFDKYDRFSQTLNYKEGENPFRIEFINNENISSVDIKTDISDTINSTITINFKDSINTEEANASMNKNNLTDYSVNQNNISMTFNYTTPEMFSALHSGDLYNILGGIYMIEMDDSGVYNKKGNITIKTISNNGIEDIKYNVWINGHELKDGKVPLTDDTEYTFKYSAFQSSNLIITLIVIISMGFVMFVLYKIFKKK